MFARPTCTGLSADLAASASPSRRHARPRTTSVLTGLLAVVVLTGCGGGPKTDRPATVPAHGVVTYRGEPVPEAVVVFQPSAHKYAAAATTDAEGKFDLKAFPPESGAVPGAYRVTLMKISQDDVVYEKKARRSVPQPKSLIPAKYADPTKSGLTVEISAEGAEELRFELKD
ncbi:hypothetical protein [Planctomyces sp. SH-PL14]|uniref:hypothetical protein n=1 Tax=Planctomyces sp. SH-PL14 TaxID=1632864 RepID=UPI00078DCF2A|nr:hypothetical protein [Planctomyces sp. SH-PL14]AMV20788.1 hypothetical protein VT03_23000 [Planctomyces sp. SH-PL14]